MEDDDKHAVYSDCGWNVEFKTAAENYCRLIAADLAKRMPRTLPHTISTYRVDDDIILTLAYSRDGQREFLLMFSEVYEPPVDYNEEPATLDANGSLEIAVADMADALLMAQHIAALVIKAQKS